MKQKLNTMLRSPNRTGVLRDLRAEKPLNTAHCAGRNQSRFTTEITEAHREIFSVNSVPSVVNSSWHARRN